MVLFLFQTKSMAVLGGATIENQFKKIFGYLFPNQFLREFSWRGTINKKAFCDLKTIRSMVLAAVMLNFPAATYADYDKFCKNYIRFSKWRKVNYREFFIFLYY